MQKELKVDIENAGIVPRDDYEEVLRLIIAQGFCPFCEEHLFKHHRMPLEYRSRHWLVTRNSWPYKGSRHHFLFIARKHIETTEELPPSVWTDLQKTYRLIVERHGLLGATLFIRSGDTQFTGASVNHIHAHIIVGGPRTGNSKPIKALVAFQQ
ncbi:MAG: HIT family protein [Minisyncoccota bacterium]